MNIIFIVIWTVLVFIALPSKAEWNGALDLSPAVNPLMLRELHDGQWLAGITKENIWHLDYKAANPTSIWNGQRFHAGLFQAWNAEHGNASFGPIIGIDLPFTAAASLGAIGNALSLQSLFKPAADLSSVVSFNAFAGYRPVHTTDVKGNFTYGVGARLAVQFGVTQLQQGQ